MFLERGRMEFSNNWIEDFFRVLGPGQGVEKS
jgi:hypothetical protein